MSEINNSNYPPTTQGPPNSVWAIVSLIAGILAWLGIFGLGGLAAVITGHIAKNEIKNSAGSLSGDGLATAGLVLGYLNLALALVGICFFILMMVGAIGAPLMCLPFMNEMQSY
jgi:hypothetical protein